MSLKKIFRNGIINENPIFVQLIALCPLLAVTTSAQNALTMGLATTAVMICASAALSAIRKIIPAEIRISAFVLIVAGFVTVIQLLMEAYLPTSINESLGIFIPLIVVNCMVFSRIEAFAAKNKVIPAVVDAFSMGLGYTAGLFLISVIREFFGNGTIFGYELLQDSRTHALIMLMAPGAFFTLGVIIMVMKHIRAKKGAGAQ